MKTRIIITVAAFLIAAAFANAGKVAVGPKGGRLLPAEPHAAEFLVTPERKVEVTLLDGAGQVVAPSTETVAVFAEAPAGRTSLTMEKSATGFISQDALPAGEPYRVVVQVRATPDAKPQNFRLDLNLGHCGGCSRAEYACTCESH